MAIKYDLNDLNSQQLKIVYDTDGAILVSAGAGSGKTRLLTHRVAYLVDKNKGKGVSQDRILAITFTNKATNEMRDRIAVMLGEPCNVWISTFHSMCVRILRENIHKLEGYNRYFSIYDDDDTKKIVKKIIKELGQDDIDKDNIIWHISNAKNMGYDADEYAKQFGFYKDIDLVTKIYKLYDEQLRLSNALDFDDLLIKTLYLLENYEDVREYYQEKFKYILVDEFQDTNLVQYKIVKILASKHGNIFVVGDEDQCIYGWRGANIGNIQDFIKDFPNCKIYKLEQNYRSTKNILKSANELIKNNASRIDKTLFTDNAVGEEVVVHTAYDETEECDYIVKIISHLIDNGVSRSNIGVLMRISSLSRIMEEKLLNYNIPYKVSGVFKFFERAEIKNVLAYMSLVVNEYDTISFERIVNFPKRGIGEASVATVVLTAIQNGVSPLNVALNSDNYNLSSAISSKLKSFASVMQKLIDNSKDMSLTDWVKYLIKTTGIDNEYNTDSEEDINRKLNIDSFVQSVASFEEANDGVGIADYLQSVTLANDLADDDLSTDKVSVSTIHAAKGLEFDYVFVIGTEEGIFPLSRSLDEPDEMEEERRLMYVAITRAKKRLYVCYAKSRFLYGKRSYTVPSRFIKEMGLEKSTLSKPAYFETKTFDYKQTYSNNDDLLYSNEMWKNKINKQTDKFSEYTVGQLVLHPKFGVGTIIKTEHIGDNSYVSVDFKGVGVKTLSLAFAPLQIIKK